MNKYGKRLNLDTLQADIIDSDPNSMYFGVSSVNTILTSGKNEISINGSDLLKINEEIQIEVLDYNKNALYVEVGVTYGKAIYRDGVSIVLSITVHSSTPKGTGFIYLKGITKNNKVVKWTKKIEINPNLQNTTKVRFYNTPEFSLDPFINVTSQYEPILTEGVTVSGSFLGMPISPIANSRFDYFDNTRENLVYQINLLSGTPFSSSMVGNEILFETGDRSKITSIKNSSTAYINTPFLKDGFVVSTSSTYQIFHTPYRQYSNELTSKKIGTAEVIFKNIETFTGNVYRYKIYRSSLNAPYDAELVSDGIFYGNENLNDTENPKRSISNIGSFYSQDQIETYWKPNHVSISMSNTHDILVDSMRISGLSSYENINNDRYVISGLSCDNSNYIPYNPEDFASYDKRTAQNSSYKTNFIRLYAGVEYIISMNLISEKVSNIDSSIDFYITSSMTSIMENKNYDGFGLKVASFYHKSSEKFTNNKKFFGKVESSFTPSSDINGTVVIVPRNGDYTISELSIKPYTDFSLNPQTFTVRIPFDAKTQNEGFNITCELFDINQNSVFRDLKTIKFFDPNGETYPFNYLYKLVNGSIEGNSSSIELITILSNELDVLSSSYYYDSGSFSSRITTNTSGLSYLSSSYYYDSGSFSSRITTNTSGLSYLSSSFLTASESLSSRITTDVNNLTNISSSLSSRITTDVNNLTNTSSSLSSRITTDVNNLTNVSSSFESRITADVNNLTNVSSSLSGRVLYFENFINAQTIRLTNGSTLWDITVSGNDLLFNRISGAGSIDIGNGIGVKILGKQVSVGINDSGGIGYQVLRVPN